MSKGLILSAPASGGGKTVLTLGLLRHLKDRGLSLAPAKTGPDYIDPVFHGAAAGRACFNLDSWAMAPARLEALIAHMGRDALVVAEGVMGLFDGAPVGGEDNRDGSTASLAARTGWPVVLVLDVRGQAASAAAVARGFATHRKDVRVAGVILNRVSGARHEESLRRACEQVLPVLGSLPNLPDLTLPSRHLGLVQAGEHDDLEDFLDRAAQAVAEHVDVDRLLGLASGADSAGGAMPCFLPPPGQRVAVARDEAFAFAYPALLEGWQAAGASVSFFSPLADEGPQADADAVYLPGGYPELHAARLSGNAGFLGGLRQAVARRATVYGECGGYMVLGRTLTDGSGDTYAMAGLLGLDTSFATRRLHLGYRQAQLIADGPLGHKGGTFRGHEFHYATVVQRGGDPLFELKDAQGGDLGATGLQDGCVIGSFIHLIDRVD